MRGWWLGFLVLVGLAVPAAAAAEPSPQLQQRAEQLVRVLRAEEPPEALFAPSFLAAVPAAQVKAIGEQLRQAYGAPTGIAAIEPKGEAGATLVIDFPKATARADMAIEPAAPYRITGLLIGNAEAKAGTLGDLPPAFRSLPGRAGAAAARLGVGAPVLVFGERAEEPFAIGSDFKLFILAELVREIRAGERRWSDVVLLGTRSLPSGILQTWPRGAPLTLHTLAALMISRSDNSAADSLLATLGREKVERLLPELGVRAAARNRPLLATREAFLLKAGDPSRLAQWRTADEAGRRRLLADLAGGDVAGLDLNRFMGKPLAIEAVEWFASPADLVRTLDWIRRSGDRTALDILAIEPGLPAAARDYAYVGYKGGSEPGVMAMAFLVRRKDGSWAAAAGAWNDPAAPVDQAQLAALMGRLLSLIR
ncbi:MAG: serine hydrolase [Alphaproteobacteria bacterium]|nr:serine hydrolase [Alphaproteobacteria bacterium]